MNSLPATFSNGVTAESLWLEGCHDPWQLNEECKKQSLSVQALCNQSGVRSSVSVTLAQGADGTHFVRSLRACTKYKDLHAGTRLHDEILKRGLLDECSDALITMYATCGEVGKAKTLIDLFKTKDVITWTSVIAGYAREGQGRNALDCYHCMQYEGVVPNEVTYVFALKACSAIGALDKGKNIHKTVAELGFLQENIILGTALVDMYAKCGALAKAQGVLERLPYRDTVSWNALITGYAQKGLGEKVFKYFKRMKREGITPNAVTYLALLKTCAVMGDLAKGRQIHDEISEQRLLQNDLSLGNALVDMYAKCGALSEAKNVLEKLPSRDVVTWSALISGYAQEHQAKQALQCFKHMQSEGIHPDMVSFVCVINACSHLGLVDEAYTLFTDVRIRYGMTPSVECCTCMIDLLGRAGLLEKAVQLIQQMPVFHQCTLWQALLGACRKWRDINVGRWAFEQLIRANTSNDSAYILMADLYADIHMHESARTSESMKDWNEQSMEKLASL